MIEDPKSSGRGVVSYYARYEGNKLVELYVANDLPEQVKQALVRCLTKETK